ncbi:MAG TPA: DUF4159 domain-containing protein [Planctomycetota bacterium]
MCNPFRMAVLLVLAGSCSFALALSEDDYFKPLGRPPEAHKNRLKGGEAVAPLPLPATPLRRSERKREPMPPTLIGKVQWGASADFTLEDGSKANVADWNMAPADCQQLLRKSSQYLKLQYNVVDTNLNSFSGDPAEIPVLFFSGGRTLKLPEEQIAMLRKYVLNGGMIWMDSVAGSPFFYEGCVKTLKQAFPEENLRKIPMDHPIYHMITDVDKANIPSMGGAKMPELEGIYCGCRVGVIVSKWGLGCGWDNFTPDFRIKQAVYYDIESATLLGLNMVSYAVGYSELGKAHARPELYGTSDQKSQGDEFVFAQVKHNGVWNSDPGGPGNLLRALATSTNVKLTFRRKTVALGQDSLQGVQFLYFAGCHDFSLSEAEADALKGFLTRGGTLLLDNSQGLKAFDIAARRELKKVLPNAELKQIDADHEVYSNYYKIGKVEFTPAVQRLEPKLNTPQVEGILIDGDLRVLYSRYDLGGGWQGSEHPQGKGYARGDALRLGVNIVTYAMTH